MGANKGTLTSGIISLIFELCVTLYYFLLKRGKNCSELQVFDFSETQSLMGKEREDKKTGMIIVTFFSIHTIFRTKLMLILIVMNLNINTTVFIFG